MPATNPQILFAEAKCYICEGISEVHGLKLALIARSVVVLDPTANVTPAALIAYGSCFNCFGMLSIGDLMELSLLDMLAQLMA